MQQQIVCSKSETNVFVVFTHSWAKLSVYCKKSRRELWQSWFLRFLELLMMHLVSTECFHGHKQWLKSFLTEFRSKILHFGLFVLFCRGTTAALWCVRTGRSGSSWESASMAGAVPEPTSPAFSSTCLSTRSGYTKSSNTTPIPSRCRDKNKTPGEGGALLSLKPPLESVQQSV